VSTIRDLGAVSSTDGTVMVRDLIAISSGRSIIFVVVVKSRDLIGFAVSCVSLTVWAVWGVFKLAAVISPNGVAGTCGVSGTFGVAGTCELDSGDADGCGVGGARSAMEAIDARGAVLLRFLGVVFFGGVCGSTGGSTSSFTVVSSSSVASAASIAGSGARDFLGRPLVLVAVGAGATAAGAMDLRPERVCLRGCSGSKASSSSLCILVDS
jgi:hypothetical protein